MLQEIIGKLNSQNTRYNLYSYYIFKSIEYNLYGVINREQKVKLAKEFGKFSILNGDTIGKIEEMFEKIYLALKSSGYSIIDVKIVTSARTLIGVSGNFLRNIFEIGLNFDWVYNVPYIPGSEIKGVIRSSIDDEELEREIFGSEEEGISQVGFTDAYPIEPVGEELLVPDVMTPHYVGARDETEVKPRPIIFLTIREGVVFRFLIYYRQQELGREICRRLRIAVLQGLGARTSTGYSYFQLREISFR
ncbi:type III-B CRISPR module RAMP protein Cmr6 [Sulfolobus sp. E5-1-F]|uniref:type III-B CRISPR module RAMP protein Cmr6 n=1 Tax=Saccharolobus sp. E5-1-F TaxID=2663019 RepID=UPI001297E6F6|nr:type III-B CRISPR module RAMP protein Cmr6 [Sulfolobus sp. E5-1-F]QGA53825.1 type III-B CRISPR module RAMP protein Cmr6 [Sulfolobus sp. E5-1-F]